MAPRAYHMQLINLIDIRGFRPTISNININIISSYKSVEYWNNRISIRPPTNTKSSKKYCLITINQRRPSPLSQWRILHFPPISTKCINFLPISAKFIHL